MVTIDPVTSRTELLAMQAVLEDVHVAEVTMRYIVELVRSTRTDHRVLANEEEGVPEVSRFNAGQKFVFWSMSLLVPVLFFTGLVIWEYYFGSYTSLRDCC